MFIIAKTNPLLTKLFSSRDTTLHRMINSTANKVNSRY